MAVWAVVAWCKLLCGSDYTKGLVNTGYAVGQNMYTPAVITISAPQPYDRPWAGLLYASRIAVVTYEEPSLDAQRQDRIELTFGMVGPASLAEQTQIGWHHVIKAHRPEGWDNQLRNEPVLQPRYEGALRWPKKEGGHADIIPRLRGNFGNALISLEAEVTGRIGVNLSGFGRSPIPATVVRSPPKPSGNLFVRAGLKAVAHNIFLDGNTFVRNDIRIQRTVLVPEVAVGIEVGPFRHVSLTFQFIHRGSEFRSLDRNAPAQEFGAFTLAWL